VKVNLREHGEETRQQHVREARSGNTCSDHCMGVAKWCGGRVTKPLIKPLPYSLAAHRIEEMQLGNINGKARRSAPFGQFSWGQSGDNGAIGGVGM